MIYAIARVKDGASYKYRLLDTNLEKVKVVIEDDIKKVLSNSKNKIENIELVSNQLKGSNGSLDRFDKKESTNNFPLVVIEEIVSGSTTLGYVVSNCNGEIKRLKEAEAVQALEKFGIQNGKLVEKEGKKFISAISGTYPKKEINKKVTPLVNREVTKENNKFDKSDFNAEQLAEIKEGLAKSLEVVLWYNPVYSAKQMRQFRLAQEAGVNIVELLNPDFSVQQLDRLRIEKESGYDVSMYCDPRYTVYQMEEIRTGLDAGVDVSGVLNPELSQERMSSIVNGLIRGYWSSSNITSIWKELT